MIVNRREFLTLASSVSLGAMAGLPMAWANKSSGGSLVFFESRYPSRADYPEAPSRKSGLKYIEGAAPFLTIADLHSGHLRRIPTPQVRGHSVVRNLARPSIVAVMPRAGLKGYLIDLEKENALRPIISQSGYFLYGHGSFSKDGKFLFTSEYDAANNGRIAIRDVADLKMVGEFPSYGLAPHDMHLVDGGKTFVIANNGMSDTKPYPQGASSIVYVDISSGKLLEKIEIKDPELAVQHLDAADNGDVAVGMDWNRPQNSKGPGTSRSLVGFRKRGGELQIYKASEEVLRSLNGNVLSVAWNRKTGTIAATNPYGPLTFWNMDSKSYVKTIKVEHPHGVIVSPDNMHFLVTGSEKVIAVTAESLEVDSTQRIADSAANINSHSAIFI